MENYGTVLNSFSDYLIYDERKGRVLHSRFLNKAQFYEMWRFHFNKIRPEYTHEQNAQMAAKQRLTRSLLGYMRFLNGREIERCYRIEHLEFPSDKCQEILLNQLNFLSPSPGAPLFAKVTSWRDAIKSELYINDVAAKIEGYGLTYPYLTPALNQEQKAHLEEQLYHHFKDLLTS